MSGSKYNRAFTTGGLFHAESSIVALEYQQPMDWKSVSDSVIKCNLLQSRSETTLKRQTRGIASCYLETLRDPDVRLLINESGHETAFGHGLSLVMQYSKGARPASQSMWRFV